MLPGGGVLLPIAARILPFDIFPSAFCRKKPSDAVGARLSDWSEYCASNMGRSTDQRLTAWSVLCASNVGQAAGQTSAVEEGVPPASGDCGAEAPATEY